MTACLNAGSGLAAVSSAFLKFDFKMPTSREENAIWRLPDGSPPHPSLLPALQTGVRKTNIPRVFVPQGLSICEGGGEKEKRGPVSYSNTRGNPRIFLAR